MKHDPNALCEKLYSRAKLSWEISLIGRLVLIGAGTISVWAAFSRVLPFVIFSLALVSESLLLTSDRYKGKAEALRRKLDLRHSFNWDIPKADIADILGSASPSLKRTIPLDGECDSYFASNDGDLAVRAMKNVEESAWWNKLLAEKMVRYVSIITTVALVGSLGFLILTLGNVTNPGTLSNVGRVVTAVLMMILSLGLVRLTLAYSDFAKKSQKSEDRARALLSTGQTSQIEAIKVYSEFHIDRATAPLVPDYLYWKNRDHFNEVWKDRMS